MEDKDIEGIKESIVEAGKLMLREGLVIGTSGNISVRVSGEEMLITPSGVDYEKMETEDLIMTDFQGKVLVGERKPSVETRMHIGIYRTRPDIGAIVHTHSVYASAAASSNRSIPPFLDELVLQVGGGIEVAQYGMPGSEELAENARKALGSRNAVLLSNHGSLCCGRNLKRAFDLAILVERTSRVFVLSSILGVPRSLPEQVVDLERKIFEISKGRK